MHRLIIHHLGPISHCELEFTDFIVLTGEQSSGKSTIAKALFFFRTVKDEITDLAKKRKANSDSAVQPAETRQNTLRKLLENHLREKFMQTFGSSWGMDNEMYMEYYYSENHYIKVSLIDDDLNPNYIWITLCDELRDFLTQNNYRFYSDYSVDFWEVEFKKFQTEVYSFFHDQSMVVFIPAGRSMITVLSEQMNYIYATMDDVQKRSLDSCIRDYMERIMKLKPEFAQGLKGIVSRSQRPATVTRKKIDEAQNLIEKILHGAYRYSNGEEQIVLDNGKYVKINFSSSGQQESVWILNLLFFYLVQERPVLFILEEPESHLFPEAQKYITELISLVKNCGHSVVLTTHSPYVLGTLNNLLYAKSLNAKYFNSAKEIISDTLWIEKTCFMAWFVKAGYIENCMDNEIDMIQNERIDEISQTINGDFEKLLEIQEE